MKLWKKMLRKYYEKKNVKGYIYKCITRGVSLLYLYAQRPQFSELLRKGASFDFFQRI